MKKEKVNINLATIAHLEKYKKEIELLICESISSSFSEVELQEYKINEIYDNLLNYVKNEKAEIYIAFIKKPVGFIWFFKIAPRRFHINYFAISSEHQGVGIGKKLLSELHRHANHVGIEEIELYVTKTNKRAILFYQKQGFKLEKKLQNEREKMVKILI